MGGKFKMMKAATAIAVALSLTGCGMADRLAMVGKPPQLSAIKNPYDDKDYQHVSMPMPPQAALNTNADALWQPGRQTFFKDQRANRVGDLLTILITISDQANLQNKTQREQDGGETEGLPNFLGFEGKLANALPAGADPSKLVGMNSTMTSNGDGQITRSEQINLKLAAMITQVLPNGNFVLRGSQEVRVNAELRQLTLSGVIRPEDILNNNSISYEKIAEARISYGGKGEMSDLQTPRYGQQFFDAVFPF